MILFPYNKKDYNALAISGCTLWLEADDYSLGTWLDKSGFGYHCTQPSGAAMPALLQNRINGRPAVRFDGINDFLFNNSFPILTAATGFFVGKFLTGGTVGRVWDRVTVGDNMGLQSTPSNTFLARTLSSATGAYTSSNVLTNSIVSIVYDGSNSRGSWNGINYLFPSIAPLSSAIGIYLGRGAAAFGNFDAGAIIFYDRALNVTEESFILSGLKAKFNIT